MAIYSRLMLGTAFTINAGNIERGNLFSTELTIFNINPTVIGKASAWSAGFLSQSVAAPAGTLSIPTATQYTRAQWEAAGWTYATLEFDIDAFVKANVVNIYGSVITDVISVTSKFSVGGTEYAIAFTYPGNVGTILAPTTPIGVSWTVGLNQFGSIGDNTIINRSSPVQVIGNHSFVQIAAAGFAIAARKANGEIWAWGENTQGGLGDGTITNKSSPVLVIGNHSFKNLTAERHFILGIK